MPISVYESKSREKSLLGRKLMHFLGDTSPQLKLKSSSSKTNDEQTGQNITKVKFNKLKQE